MLPVLFDFGPLLIPAYGAMTALGVLLALLMAEQAGRRAGFEPGRAWNLCVLALFAALLASRLLLVAWNWRDLQRHPMWLLGLATIHNPLLAAVGALVGLAVAMAFAHAVKTPLAAFADVLAAPLALAIGFEQIGALLAGSSYGLETTLPWAVTYTDLRAALWSGTPLGIPLHPVQAYAAMGCFAVAVFSWVAFPLRRQVGDVAGAALLASGAGLFVTEFFRDREGRGAILGGALDGPQIVAVGWVLMGGWILRERREQSGDEARKEGSNE